MGDSIRCFGLVVTNEYVVSLRRYASGSKCAKDPVRVCDASVRIDVVRWDGIERANTGSITTKAEPAWGWGGNPITCEPPYTSVTSYHDRRWPKRCDRCRASFAESDEWQLNMDVLFDRTDGGPRTTLRAAPPGAMYWMDWFANQPGFCGPDGRALAVVLPGNRVWHVDGRASNCTKPKDTKHNCWVRSGEIPDVTVGKDGETCEAGAGSIQVPGWHGFLRQGVLVPC
jgi:hypothetical protein